MKSKSKKGCAASTTTFFGCIALLALFLVSTIFYYYHMNKVPGSSSHVDVNELNALLNKAQALTQRYKDLTDHDFSRSGPRRSNSFGPLASGTEGNSGEKSALLSPKPSSPRVLNGSSTELILGMALNTDPKNLAVFCRSLRSVSQAQVMLFTNLPIPERNEKIAEDTNVQFIGIDFEMAVPASMHRFHPSTLRWPLMYNHLLQLEKSSAHFERVLMLDVRDTFFQRDPFMFIRDDKEHEFHAFKERMTIKDCGWNSGWVKDCFGRDMLHRIGHNIITCSGVSGGTISGALSYMKMMNDIIVSSPDAVVQSQYPSCERNGVDQGTHNVLVHTGAIRNLKLWNEQEGHVANLQSKLSYVKNNRDVYNKAGAKLAVVHQYDRYPELQKTLFEKYVDWINTNSLGDLWKEEKACDLFEYKENVDMNKGMCDLKSLGGASSAASCCAHCNSNKECKAFTFYLGSCFLKSCNPRAKSGTSLQGSISGYLKSSL